MKTGTIAELLDRAVTLFVQNAWVFIALAAILYVPMALSQLAMGDFWLWYLRTMSKVLAHPGNPAAAGAMNAQLMARAVPMEIITFALLILVAPFVVAAMAHVTLGAITATPSSLGDALKFAVSRWGRVVLFAIIWGLALTAAFLGLTMVLGLVTAVLGFAMRSVALIISFGVVMFVALIVCSLLAFVSGGVGMIAAINEPPGPLTAFGAGIARTLNRKMFWRSLLVGLVLFAIAFGFSIMASIAGFSLLAWLHSGIPLVVINAIVAMVQLGFLIVFMVFFYNDISARREGADLEALAARLSV